MLLRLIYDDVLAQAAYLIGCQRTGEAIVFDPERDVDRYIAAAAREHLRITAVADTHIHADFLSGSRELAEVTGAKLYLSGAGGAEWTPAWLNQKSGGGSYSHQLIQNGDTFRVGNIEFRVLHTPGHTPEHVCFVVTDRGGGAAEPMGIISGDFVFVGDLGRPDLLESAAGRAGAADSSARALHKSVTAFLGLPDFIQVWPGHGAGSACGKALGAVPQSTVGYERRFNPAILAATASETRFIDFILAGQPEPPMYFARMKRDNVAGPRVLGALPAPAELSAQDAARLDAQTTAIIDTRAWKLFREGHIAGSLFAPLDNMFLNVVGSYVGEHEPIVLIAEPREIETIVRLLVRIGLDRVAGWIRPATLAESGKATSTIAEVSATQAAKLYGTPGVFALDVRRADEFAEGHVKGAMHAAYPRLPARLEQIPRDKSILVNCRSGARSARACAYLARRGYKPTNLAGGYLAWEKFLNEPTRC